MALWSPKGGSGLSTVAASVAALSARRHPTVLVDLAGDQPALCGLATDPEVGVHDWLADGSIPPSGVLGRLGHAVAPGLTLLPPGGATGAAVTGDGAGGDRRMLGSLAEAVVVDAGPAEAAQPRAVVEEAAHSILVTRACYLALRRAVVRAELVEASTGVVVLVEEHRALRVDDVARVLGLPVLATVPADRDIARSVDAGTLVTRPPRRLVRALAPVAARLAPAARTESDAA